jgi:arylsulfatase A-like enzyme
LKHYDYSTHAVGKWHLGFYRKEYAPTYRGFDSHVGFWTGFQDYYNYLMVGRDFMGLDFRNNMDVILNISGIYSTEYYTDRALELISNHNVSKPMFLYMSYPNVHAANNYDNKLQAPEEMIEKFSYIKDENRRKFAAMAYAMDESIGKIFNKLNDKKLLDNSIIVFLSDNGGAISGLMGKLFEDFFF